MDSRLFGAGSTPLGPVAPRQAPVLPGEAPVAVDVGAPLAVRTLSGEVAASAGAAAAASQDARKPEATSVDTSEGPPLSQQGFASSVWRFGTAQSTVRFQRHAVPFAG